MYYRRDISSILTTITVILAVFIGYQLWVKPAPQTASLSQGSPNGLEEPSFATPPTSIDTPAPSPADVPISRLVELGEAPDESLAQIREEFEKANYGETEQRLKSLTLKTVTQAPARRYVAGLWNNLGIQQEKLGGTARSVRAFKQAVVWDPSSPLAHLNLTQAYWERRDAAMTPRFLETVIRLAPDDPFPHMALAEVLLAQGKSGLAGPHLEQARAKALRDPNLKSYWQKLSGQLDTYTKTASRQGAPRAAEPPVTPTEPTPLPESTVTPVTPTDAPSTLTENQASTPEAEPPKPAER